MKFSKIAILAAATLTLSPVAHAADEWTEARSIGSLEVNKASGATYVISSPQGWGAAGCPAAVYITLDSGELTYKTMVAQLLTAKAADITVSVFGECTNAVYFEVKQLRVN